MRKYKIFIMAFVLLFLLAGAVNASEVEDISDSTVLKDNGYDLNIENSISDSDNEILGSEDSSLSSNDDIIYSDKDVLGLDKDSQLLESEKDFNGNSFSQLQNEINNCNENDTIILNNDIFQEGSNPISITKSLVIDGNGHTIDAQQKSGIFTIRATNVILRNINFKNAGGGSSGAVEIFQTKCVIENCNFENNNVSTNGAAILFTSGNLSVSNSTFKNNSANTRSGGAVYSLADIHMDNCTFIGNHAYAGGAIYSSDCHLTNCIFINNDATTTGGSLYSTKGEISNCTFINGSSNLGAGVLLVSNEGRIVSSRFINNSANIGGAIYITGRVESQSKNITIENCTFEDNYADNRGGAIYSDGENYTIDNCTFKNNSAKNDGGAIYNNYIGFISNSNLTNNFAKNGGALYNVFNVTLINDTFENNNATLGGAIYSANCNLTSCNLISNSATEAGGAIYLTTNISTMYLCNFTYNSANNGGAIYLLNNNGTMDFCDFVNNSANNGGAIYSIGSAVTMEFSQFISNNASNNGGAFFLDSSNQYVLTYSSFWGNGASKEGGAIYCTDSNLTAYYTFFINNSASRAGAIHYINSTALIENCDFDYNVANGDAGAIIFNDSNSTVRNSFFEFNVAGKKGAAIYSTLSGNLTLCDISSSTFLNNKAQSYSLTSSLTNGVLTFILTGWNNYVNAIYAESAINISDITYWNGDIVNSDDEFYNYGASGQNITLEIYDSRNNLLTNTTLVTNTFGEQYYSIVNLDDGFYTYRAYHLDDDYYTYVNNQGNFTLNRFGSSITLNIADNAEFDYMNCTIPFDIVNRTEVKVLITSDDESLIYVNGTVDQYSRRIAVNLAANEDYYKITVFNLPSSVYRGSQDSKLFKINGVGSSISINPIDDVVYGQNVNVTFDVENRTVIEVSVFDENNERVYRIYTINDTISLPVLPAGHYNITATNMGMEDIYESNASTTFNILKANNIVNISADDVVYGNWTTITISAQADGNYSLDFNGSLVDVEVIGGEMTWELLLPAGDYYVNASFDNDNYISDITNATFTVSKANNTALVMADDVVYGNDVTIKIFSPVNGIYLLDVNGTFVNVSVFNLQGKVMMNLPVGEYYANAVFDNPNYNTLVTNATFRVLEPVPDKKTAKDIQDLIDNAEEGSVVDLGNFDYVNVSNVNITKDITLMGNGATITGAGDGSPMFIILPKSQDGPDDVNITNIQFNVNNGDVIVRALADNATGNSIDVANINISNNNVSAVSDDVVTESVVILELDSEKGVLSPNAEISISGNVVDAGVKSFNFVVTSIASDDGIDIGPQDIINERKLTVIEYSDMVTTAVDVDTDGRIGEYFKVVLKDADGNPLAGKAVQIGFNGKIYNRTTNETGGVKLQINLVRTDIYTFAVSFLGDDDYNGSFVVAKITVNTQKGSLTVPNKSYAASAKTKSLTATFKAASGKVVAGKKVTFTVNGKTYSATTNAKGVATVNVSLNSKGTYSFTAKYAGDVTYAAISKSAKLTIK